MLLRHATILRNLPGIERRGLPFALLLAYLVADNAYGMAIARFADHPDDPSKLEYFVGTWHAEGTWSEEGMGGPFTEDATASLRFDDEHGGKGAKYLEALDPSVPRGHTPPLGIPPAQLRATHASPVDDRSCHVMTDEGPASVEGTIVTRNAERITNVNDFDIEIAPAPRMVFFNYVDRPGIIGKVGTILGEHSINIATMDVGRKPEGQGMEALMCVTVDSDVPPEVLEHIALAIEAKRVRPVTLPD